MTTAGVERRRDLLPDDLQTLYTGPDGHLYVAEGDGRTTTRLSWAADDFVLIPGLPPIPGVAGELEDDHVFAHPTASRDGTRVAVFGLLPTLDEELWDFDGANPWETVQEAFPYLDPAAEDEQTDDVAADGLVVAVMGDVDEDEIAAAFDEPDEDIDPDDLPRFWPGGKVYVVHTDGVQVTEPLSLEGGSPTHLEWAPDDRHLLVLHQDEDALHLHLVDGVEPADPWLLLSGAPVFWSWQPHGQLLAVRAGLMGTDEPMVLMADPLGADPDGGLELGQAGSFYVPAWHPRGDRLAWGTAHGREDDLVVTDARGENRERLVSYPGRGAFRWDARGEQIALAIAPEGHGAFEALEVLDLLGSSSNTVWQAPFVAFSWLPGDRSILLCEANDEDGQQGRLRWIVLDLDSGRSRPVGPSWAPSREMVVALHFFEQVGTSHPFLSQDGRHVMYAGVPDDDVLSMGADTDPMFLGDEEPSRVLVTPLAGGPTVAVGQGRFACAFRRR